jgi:hypothetical protein
LPVDDTLGLYNYSPNMPAAVVGTLSFTAISMIHLWKFSRHQSWCFLAMIAGVLGKMNIPTKVSAKLTDR